MLAAEWGTSRHGRSGGEPDAEWRSFRSAWSDTAPPPDSLENKESPPCSGVPERFLSPEKSVDLLVASQLGPSPESPRQRCLLSGSGPAGATGRDCRGSAPVAAGERRVLARLPTARLRCRHPSRWAYFHPPRIPIPRAGRPSGTSGHRSTGRTQVRVFRAARHLDSGQHMRTVDQLRIAARSTGYSRRHEDVERWPDILSHYRYVRCCRRAQTAEWSK